MYYFHFSFTSLLCARVYTKYIINEFVFHTTQTTHCLCVCLTCPIHSTQVVNTRTHLNCIDAFCVVPFIWSGAKFIEIINSNIDNNCIRCVRVWICQRWTVPKKNGNSKFLTNNSKFFSPTYEIYTWSDVFECGHISYTMPWNIKIYNAYQNAHEKKYLDDVCASDWMAFNDNWIEYANLVGEVGKDQSYFGGSAKQCELKPSRSI